MSKPAGFALAGGFALVTAPLMFAPRVDARPATNGNLQSIYGPLACAADSAYRRWLAGPLHGAAPDAASFSATASAQADAFSITFAPLSGGTPAKATYTIAASTCTNAAWPQVPALADYSKGPLTLTGTYVLAFDAANTAHARSQPKTFTPSSTFAYLDSPESGVSITTLPAPAGTVLVSFTQRIQSNSTATVSGCYKTQHYLVNAKTLAVTPTSFGCIN